jgi:hypothetical protein
VERRIVHPTPDSNAGLDECPFDTDLRLVIRKRVIVDPDDRHEEHVTDAFIPGRLEQRLRSRDLLVDIDRLRSQMHHCVDATEIRHCAGEVESHVVFGRWMATADLRLVTFVSKTPNDSSSQPAGSACHQNSHRRLLSRVCTLLTR